MAQNTFTTPIDTQEIDSDPYSDSDEESIASKSPSLPPKPEKSALNDESASSDSAGSSHHIEHGVPRKLQRARRCIHTAIKNLVDITLRDSPSSGANSKGGRGAWEELGLSLSGLIGCLDDRVLADVPTRSHLAVLIHLISLHLVPLALSKEYRQSLTKHEARALPSFSKHLQRVREHVCGADLELSVENANVLKNTPSMFLPRLIRPESCLRHLNLSSLCTGTADFPAMEFVALFRLLAIKPEKFTYLSLTNNGLHHLPSLPWSLFTNLQVLNISHNPKLRSLPIDIVKLPSLRRVRMRGADLSPRPSMPIISRPSTPSTASATFMAFARKGPTPLLESCISLLLNTYGLESSNEDRSSLFGSMGLPPHLESALRTAYRCDLCGLTQMISSPGWIRKCITLAYTVRDERSDVRKKRPGKEVKVEGRICIGCVGVWVELPLEV